jgi:hypothetical protein
MDSSTSDLQISSDLDLTTSSYNLNSNKISPVAIFLILILIIMLIGFFINNMTINNFEPNLENENRHTVNKELKEEVISEKTNNSSINVKHVLNMTNQKLNNSINKLTDLVNKTGNNNNYYNDEIQILEKNIQDLKSEIIILQSKLLDQELNKTKDKKTQNINITTEPAHNLSYTNNNFQDPSNVVIYDPIANYDRLKLTDPLIDPRGRSSADQIPTPQVAAQLNYPTQGVIDRYHRIGLLIAVNSDSDNYHSNKKKFNTFETNADYSMNNLMSSSPKINANLNNQKYNGIELVTNSNSNFSMSSTNNTNNDSTSNPLLVYTSKTEKNKKHKRRKHKHKKEHFELEGFTTENYYETFENNFNDGDNFTNLENSINEGFNNTETNKNKDYVNFGQNDNNILELIGKKITDNWYKYFTSISVGNKVIKINVHNRNRRELYDGDIVFIPEIGRRFRVQIDKMDMIEYNPYFF